MAINDPVIIDDSGGSGGSGVPIRIQALVPGAFWTGSGVHAGQHVQVAFKGTLDVNILGAKTFVWRATFTDVHNSVSEIALSASGDCGTEDDASFCRGLVIDAEGTYTVYFEVQVNGHALHTAFPLKLRAVTVNELLAVTGRVVFLQAHELGTGWGGPPDFIDVEVVAKLDTRPDMAFGIQLRNDALGPARRAMFDLLRDAFATGAAVTLDYAVQDPHKNAIILRTALTKA